MDKNDIMTNQEFGLTAVLYRIRRIIMSNLRLDIKEIAGALNKYARECMEIQVHQEDKRNLFIIVLYPRQAIPYDWFPNEKEQRYALEKALAAYLYILMQQKGFLVKFCGTNPESTLGISLHCSPFTQNELADAYERMGGV